MFSKFFFSFFFQFLFPQKNSFWDALPPPETVNARPVRILLECILVGTNIKFYVNTNKKKRTFSCVIFFLHSLKQILTNWLRISFSYPCKYLPLADCEEENLIGWKKYLMGLAVTALVPLVTSVILMRHTAEKQCL